MHSPCIDAGDPKSEYKNEPKPNGSRVNMGAYGNTKEASRSTVKQKLALKRLGPFTFSTHMKADKVTLCAEGMIVDRSPSARERKSPVSGLSPACLR